MNKSLLTLALGAALAIPGAAQAQQEAPNTGALSFSGGADVTHAYYFRGFLMEDRGIIVQPHLNMHLGVMETEDLTANVYIGQWNSFHTRHTGATQPSARTWFESRLYGGVEVLVGAFTVDAVYTAYISPNGAFQQVQEVGLTVGFDDSELMDQMGMPFSVNPYLGVFFETRGASGTYMELGIAPEFEIQVVGTETPIKLSFPVVLGAGLDDYYFNVEDDGTLGEDRFFGYFSVGVLGTMPLPVPAEYGNWSAVAGLTWLYLGDNNARAVNRDEDRDAWIGKLGIAFEY